MIVYRDFQPFFVATTAFTWLPPPLSIISIPLGDHTHEELGVLGQFYCLQFFWILFWSSFYLIKIISQPGLNLLFSNHTVVQVFKMILL